MKMNNNDEKNAKIYRDTATLTHAFAFWSAKEETLMKNIKLTKIFTFSYVETNLFRSKTNSYCLVV